MSKLLFISILVLGSLVLSAQHFNSRESAGSVKGIVLDSNSPVEFVNVFITLKSDTTKIITGSVTDSLGRFYIGELNPGDYILNVQMIGYKQKRMVFSLTMAEPNKNLAEITIEVDALVLNSVQVSAMRNMVKKTEDGLVITAADNLTQIGGTAADLLKNMPGILVTAEGGITIRGKSPLILFNGRTSGIAGTGRTAQLERIPATSIERIEIINNPSAKYDADAEAGIINIILKKNEDNGTNGAFALGMGLGDRYRLNGSALLNHKTDRWNLGVAYDNWYTTRTRKVNGDRINFELPDEYFLTQRRFDERLIFYQNAKANIDYTPNEKSKLNFEALWAFPGEDNNETLRNMYRNSENNFTSKNKRHSNEIRRSHAVESSLHYAKRFHDPDKLLNINVSSALNYDRENTDITTQNLSEQDDALGNPLLQRTHKYQDSNISSIAVDYSQPLSNARMIESGYKGIIRYLNADFERASKENEEFILDPENTGVFEFTEQIHAAYMQYTGWTGERDAPIWKYDIGIRAEQVWNNGKTHDKNEDFSNTYFNLYPSATVLRYNPDRSYFKLSYSRRINRPGLGQLNPFTDITDSLNQRAGNPKLKPELVHSIETGYHGNAGKASLSVAFFCRLTNNAILPYTVLDQNGVAFTRPLNFGKASTYGLEAIVTYNAFSFWNINLSFSAYEIQIHDSGAAAEVSTRQVNWYTKLINDFTLFKNSRIQVVASYTSPTAIPQGESVAVHYVDLGFQQTILKGKGRLGLTVTDIFDTQEYGFITADDNFEFSRIFKLDTRAAMLTFGYTFGASFREKLMENRFKNE